MYVQTCVECIWIQLTINLNMICVLTCTVITFVVLVKVSIYIILKNYYLNENFNLNQNLKTMKIY